MSKILKNNTAAPVDIVDTGVTVPASGNYTIPPQDYDTFAASSNVIELLADLTLTLNDGSSDVSILSDAIDIIKGWFPQGVSASEVPFFFDFSDLVSGDAPVTLVSITVPGTDSLYISHLVVSCRTQAYIEVQKNGDVIATLRTGSSAPDQRFDWSPNRECLDGDVIEVILTKLAGSDDITVGAHLMGVTAAPS